MTFQEVVESINKLSKEERSSLIRLIHQTEIEEEEDRILNDVIAAQEALAAGEVLKFASFIDLNTHLLKSLEEDEEE